MCEKGWLSFREMIGNIGCVEIKPDITRACDMISKGREK